MLETFACVVELLARDDDALPAEVLPAVDHHREVDPDLGVEDPRHHGARLVDDGEHRRRDDVGVAGRARGLDVEVQRVRLADRRGVLLDLLAADGIDDRRVLPSRSRWC